MSAVDDTPALAQPPDDLLLLVGRELAQREVALHDVPAAWVRAQLVWRSHDDAWAALADEDCKRIAERAAQLAQEEECEARAAAGLVPEPREARIAPLPGFTSSAIWEGAVLVSYLVRFILVRGGLTVLFGMSGHLKTVVATALAFAVGTGRECFGLRVERAGVVYIVGEGHAGMRKRARAWLLEYGYDATSEQPLIYFTSAGANLVGDPLQVRATVEHASKVLGAPIGLIVIDTLTANAGPADLNDTRDMQLAIAGAQTAAPGAAVLLVHHVGHADPNRERNSYQLIAAADVRLQAIYDEQTKILELKWKKLKDDDAPESLLFKPKIIPLGWEDEEGEEVTSIVLERLEGTAPMVAAGPRAVGLGVNQEKALVTLRKLLANARKNIADRGDDPSSACILTTGWRTACAAKGIDAKRWPEVLKALKDRGLVRIEGPHAYPVDLT